MQISRALRNRLLTLALVPALFMAAPPRAHAVSKEIIELQTQVQQLLDMVQRLQSTMDTRFGVMQHLVEQTADSANRMTASVNTLQQKLASQEEASSSKLDTTSGQVQSLNDSVDELKTRMDKLQKSIQDLQSQLQNIQTPPAGQTGPAGTSAPSSPNSAPMPGGAPGPGAANSAPAAPPLQDTYQSAIRDFDGARYSVAQGEFQDIVQYYPQDELAGTAQFYLGEIAYRQQQYDDAVKAYNIVLENYSGSAKSAAAQLHKGLALLKMNKRDSGVQELRLLVRRHPQTPEAAQARTKLNGMGVRLSESARR